MFLRVILSPSLSGPPFHPSIRPFLFPVHGEGEEEEAAGRPLPAWELSLDDPSSKPSADSFEPLNEILTPD